MIGKNRGKKYVEPATSRQRNASSKLSMADLRAFVPNFISDNSFLLNPSGSPSSDTLEILLTIF